MFKKDSIILGILIGLFLPASLFSLLYILNLTMFVQKFSEPTIFLVSICSNLIPFRILLINYKFDRTGKGILIVTFVYAIVYLIRYLN